MSFEKRLVNLRNKKKISQYALADLLDVDRGRYSKWEQGKARPSYEMLIQLADYFGVTADYLIGRSNEPLGEIPVEVVEGEGIAYDENGNVVPISAEAQEIAALRTNQALTRRVREIFWEAMNEKDDGKKD